ncbi:hypothetical protein [Pseudothauera rhizosphaerae]|uniref:Uncharacterized protein n=1 Tax=Pseudothauera rhizosphaerae TaxID=2565932 RepID=A0A4S4AJ64_9RHOO|nr:hypothetical protein [Pseudothauera rhizosphaerae]THF59435.1 hypothetical protein E6O51_15705 [Pseudothauera rhizosphaerae]
MDKKYQRAPVANIPEVHQQVWITQSGIVRFMTPNSGYTDAGGGITIDIADTGIVARTSLFSVT